MEKTAASSDEAFDALRARSLRLGERSARLVALSDAASAHLSALLPRDPAATQDETPKATVSGETTLSQQMTRCHVLIVNSDPAFLDAARVLLQSDRYNVTSTNLVPQTFAMICIAQPDALIIDLATDEPALWGLVGQLVEDPRMRAVPVVFTASDDAMLEAAETRPWPSNGRFHLLKPFEPTLLGDVIHALIGPA